VEVVEDEDQWPPRRQLIHQRADRPVVSVALGGRSRLGLGEIADRREHAGEMGQMMTEGLQAPRLERAQEVVEGLDEGGERHLPLELGAPPREHGVPAPGGPRRKL